MAIIGAGPIGLYIAGELSKMGYEVTVFEEHPDIGNPSHCSGLFSTNIFDIVGKIGILHPSRRARIHAPSGEVMKIGNEKIRSYVVNRVRFDREMAKRAVEMGATIHLREKVKKIRYPEIVTGTDAYRCKIILGADGINSVVRKSMGVKSPKILGAAQVTARYPVYELDTVDIFLGSSVAPGFFAWIIPLFDNLVKVGLASYGNSWNYLKGLIKKLKIQPLSVSGGGIPINTVERTYARGILIVGDAAGQVKATSGGGVYPGLMAAKCAVETASRALDAGKYDENMLKNYETCWRSGIGKELKNASYLHRIYRKIRDEDFNGIIRALNDERVIEVINREGDIDYPSRVVMKVLRKKPSLLRYISIPARPYRKQI